MKNILKLMLSAVILFGAVPTANASDMNMAAMEEVKKKKKKKGKKLSEKGKKKKRGFFSKIFGSK
jgi:muconolactone delta-isomerase